ncbi:secretory carrier-associated membrane protein [Paragonimus westermani]|uniref:Secretory carrier-associated membrane protein n=1 Tax=Paragonimus westermani TaxID=34504 RepID=A0A5J4NMM3_9TREM|nr:secretory carrier-associated membrane protein [Paragonimus westermani]
MATPPGEGEGPFGDPARTLKSMEPGNIGADTSRIETAALGDYNPFAADDTHLTGQIVPNSNFLPSYSSVEAQRLTTAELERRQKELDAKAAELARREEEQNRLAEQARRGGLGSGPAKNWPPLPSFLPCGPCFYQDIELEITQEFQKIVKFGYYLWLSYAALLCLNLFGAFLFFVGTGALSGGSLFGVAILVCALCIPASFICWFRPLYKAFRSNSSVNFFIFFFVFGVQVVIMGIQSLGILNWGSCGWITGLTVIKSNPAIGVITLLIACLFTVLTVVGAMYLIRVHHIYRSTGASFGKAREELVRGMASDPSVRAAAIETGVYAAHRGGLPRN